MVLVEGTDHRTVKKNGKMNCPRMLQQISFGLLMVYHPQPLKQSKTEISMWISHVRMGRREGDRFHSSNQSEPVGDLLGLGQHWTFNYFLNHNKKLKHGTLFPRETKGKEALD